MAQMEIKKMKQGMSYSRKEKTIILNVFKYFLMQYPDKCVTEIVRRTAKATGCSEKSIFQFRKEEASAEGFKEPSKKKVRRNININSRTIKYDNNVRQAIRYIIYDLKYRGIVPSLNTILKQVKGDATLPNFSLMTLRRLMFEMGFSYEKNGNKSVLVDKADPTLNNQPHPSQTHKKPQQPENPKPDPPPPPPPQICQNPPPNHNHQMQYPVVHEQQRLMPVHMIQRDEHIAPPPPPPPAPMHNPHNMQMFPGMRRDCVPSHHGQPLHSMPPHPPSNVNMHVKMEMPHWVHPIVQHS